MYLLEIAIQRRVKEVWPVVAQFTASNEPSVRREGALGLDVDKVKKTGLREYGARLGRPLFDGNVLDTFRQALSRVDGDALHVLLFVEADELRPLHWERLEAPIDGTWKPLAIEQRTPFALHLPSATDRRFPAISRPDLKALIVVASPRGKGWESLKPFDAVAAVRSVIEALGPIPYDVLADVEIDPDRKVGPPTLDALCNAITGNPYTLLHIVAHGRFRNDDNEPVLYLARHDGDVDPVTASRLIERLGMVQGARGLPRLAFFATCDSAAPEAEGVLGGLAQRLVRDLGMPAVVAMTDRIDVDTALKLTSEFYKRLRQSGLVDLALTQAFAGLAGRETIAVPVPALFSRLGGLPLFSLAPDSVFSDGEIRHGLERLEDVLPIRAPILREPFRGPAATLRGLLGINPDALDRTRRQERERALSEIDEICLEAAEISFEALANDEETPAYDARCPFRGLEAFNPFRPRDPNDPTDDPANDANFFFGREPWIRTLRERLDQHNFLAVLGPSGSGKSSVVLAGLVPALMKAEPGLVLRVFRPRADALRSLEEACSGLGERDGLIVVDQFEEVFTLGSDPDRQRAFFDRLLGLADSHRVVVTMRADFWGDCAAHDALRERMVAHQVLVSPMTPEDLRMAMSCQAHTVGLRFEPGLDALIFDDVVAEPGRMPLLQHALLELWKRRHSRLLKAEEYQTLGQVKGAIARTAESVYEELRSDRERIREIFVRLTRVDEVAATGEARRDGRRPVPLDRLVPAGGSLDETRVLVHRLADRRLLVIRTPERSSAEPEAGVVEVEVAHEALIRHWPRLTTWLDENRALLRLRDGIIEAADAWERVSRLVPSSDRTRFRSFKPGILSLGEPWLVPVPRLRRLPPLPSAQTVGASSSETGTAPPRSTTCNPIVRSGNPCPHPC